MDVKTLIFGKNKELIDNIIENQIKNTKNTDIIFINDYEKINNEDVKNLEFESTYKINPLDLFYQEEWDLYSQIDFLYNFIEEIINRPLTPKQKSLLDKIISDLYKPYIHYLKKSKIFIDVNKVPTLKELFDRLFSSKNEEMNEIGLALEIFCRNSSSIFCGHTNICLNEYKTKFNIYNGFSHYMNPLIILNLVHYSFIQMKINFFINKKSTILVFKSINEDLMKNWKEYFYSVVKRIRMISGNMILSFDDISLINSEIGRTILCNFENVIISGKTNDYEKNIIENTFGLNENQKEKLNNITKDEYLIL